MSILSINAQTLKAWLDKDEAVLVDVREPAEYAAQHISGSVLVPLGEVSVEKIPNYQGKKLVLHCKAGSRSMSACSTLKKALPDEVFYSLEGGINAWASAGLPVKGSGKSVFSIDRQVQVTIGVALIVFSLLAWFINPLFILGTGFFGLGLSFAGLTGFCGLARLMAKAPWNKSV